MRQSTLLKICTLCSHVYRKECACTSGRIPEDVLETIMNDQGEYFVLLKWFDHPPSWQTLKDMEPDTLNFVFEWMWQTYCSFQK